MGNTFSTRNWIFYVAIGYEVEGCVARTRMRVWTFSRPVIGWEFLWHWFPCLLAFSVPCVQTSFQDSRGVFRWETNSHPHSELLLTIQNNKCQFWNLKGGWSGWHTVKHQCRRLTGWLSLSPPALVKLCITAQAVKQYRHFMCLRSNEIPCTCLKLKILPRLQFIKCELLSVKLDVSSVVFLHFFFRKCIFINISQVKRFYLNIY